MDALSLLLLRLLIAALHALPLFCLWKAFEAPRAAKRSAPEGVASPAAWKAWAAAVGWLLAASLFAAGALLAGPPWFAKTPSDGQPVEMLSLKRGDVALAWKLSEGLQRSSGFHLRRGDGKEAYVHFASDQFGYWLRATSAEDGGVVRFRVWSANPKLWTEAAWDPKAETLKVGESTANLKTLFETVEQE